MGNIYDIVKSCGVDVGWPRHLARNCSVMSAPNCRALPPRWPNFRRCHGRRMGGLGGWEKWYLDGIWDPHGFRWGFGIGIGEREREIYIYMCVQYIYIYMYIIRPPHKKKTQSRKIMMWFCGSIGNLHYIMIVVVETLNGFSRLFDGLCLNVWGLTKQS